MNSEYDSQDPWPHGVYQGVRGLGFTEIVPGIWT